MSADHDSALTAANKRIEELTRALEAARSYLSGTNPLNASGGHRNMDLRNRIDAILSKQGGER